MPQFDKDMQRVAREIEEDARRAGGHAMTALQAIQSLYDAALAVVNHPRRQPNEKVTEWEFQLIPTELLDALLSATRRAGRAGKEQG